MNPPSPEQRVSRPRVVLVLELHGRPRDLQLLEHPLHRHLLDGLVNDVVDLVLEVVKVQAQEIGQAERVRLSFCKRL